MDPATPLPIFPVVIGTAGHVDHGKSSLVRALTGTNPDRLAEEQERGLTIDIGFASFALPDGQRVGVIDVPGHERFIKNMITGATGIGYVMLVVAADDGVMPQTREHMQILELMGVKRGCVVLTKTDLVDAELIEVVEEDIRESLGASFLSKAKVLPVSVKTGAGVEELLAHLCAEVVKVPLAPDDGAFRMPVQRVFSARGHGSVLTGIPLSGSVALGDVLETFPSGQSGKVRGIHAYHHARQQARAGHSSALNLAGVDHQQVHRGHLVASPGYLSKTRRVALHFHLLEDFERTLKTRTQVKLLLNNAEVVGTLTLLSTDKPELQPGSSAVVQLELDEDVVPVVGDRCIIRLPSPSMTLGGGRLLKSLSTPLRPKDHTKIHALQQIADGIDKRDDLADALVLFAGSEGVDTQTLHRELWLKDGALDQLVAKRIKKGVWLQLATKRLVHRDAWNALTELLTSMLVEWHKGNPGAAGLRVAELAQRSGVEVRLLNEVLASLEAAGIFVRTGEVLAHRDYSESLPADLVPMKDKLLARIRATPFEPPSIEEIPALIGANSKQSRSVCDYVIMRADASLVGGSFLFGKSAIDQAIGLSRQFIAEHGEMKASEFKNLLGTSRKYAIPLLEYLDGQGVFVNVGGVRRLKPGS